MRKKVLIMAGYYIPSVKGGGPIRSIKNLVDNLSDEFDFYVMAADRDLGDDIAFENIQLEKWIKVDKARVLYTNIEQLTLIKIFKLLKNIDFEILYLNSFFDFKFSIVPIILNKLKRIKFNKIVLAPRGQFSRGALNLKNTKKCLFILLSKILGLHKNITWHATAETEKEDIELVYGKNIDVKVANNLTANYDRLKFSKKIIKNLGELKLVFVSRIHPKKNLKLALKLLISIKGIIYLDIYGPIEDKKYWEECKKVISSFSSNIIVNYNGVVSHNEILDIFNNHHVFLFPTLGENFGHVISEALIGGCPVIISDQTPWRELEKAIVGWDIELNKEEKFIEAIQYCVDLTEEDYYRISKNCFIYGKHASSNKMSLNEYKKLFKV